MISKRVKMRFRAVKTAKLYFLFVFVPGFHYFYDYFEKHNLWQFGTYSQKIKHHAMPL